MDILLHLCQYDGVVIDSSAKIMQTIDYDGFAAFLALNDRQSTTIKKHLNCLHYLERHEVKFTREWFDSFCSGLKLSKKSNSYLNMFVNVLRLYARYKNIEELKELKGFKKTNPPKATMSDDEIEAFLTLPRRFHEPTSHYFRYQMLWNLIAFTGCRPGEVSKLQKKHIDWGRGVIIIEQSKTGQPGQVPIPPNIKSLLEEYLEELKTDYLFPSERGGNHYSCGGEAVIDNVDWHWDWTKRLKALDLKRPHLTPYSFRHSYCTRLLEENVSLFHVKRLMRHRDLKSTLVYEHLTTKDLIEAQQRHPLIRKGADPKLILRSLIELFRSFNIEKDSRFKYLLEENQDSVKFEVHIK